MKLIVDECVGLGVIEWLRSQGHDVLAISEEHPGITDDQVLTLSLHEERILITCDKDFGEMIFRFKKAHSGIILLRLTFERPEHKIHILSRLFKSHDNALFRNYVVVTETTVKIVKVEDQRT